MGADGRFSATVAAGDSVALYVGAGGGSTASPSPTATSTTSGAAFGVNATTQYGQNVFVVGDVTALGGWDPARAVALSSASYPVWRAEVTLPAGTRFAYKYVRKDASGAVTWESGANRTASVPASGKVALNDTWRN